jgi:hypothetical protein
MGILPPFCNLLALQLRLQRSISSALHLPFFQSIRCFDHIHYSPPKSGNYSTSLHARAMSSSTTTITSPADIPTLSDLWSSQELRKDNETKIPHDDQINKRVSIWRGEPDPSMFKGLALTLLRRHHETQGGHDCQCGQRIFDGRRRG